MCTNNQHRQCHQSSFNCSLRTVVYNKDIPKTVVPHQKTLGLFTLTPKHRYFSGTHKCIPQRRFNLHHFVLQFLVCVDVGNSFQYCSYLVQFSSSQTCLPCILVCFRSDPPENSSPTYLSTIGLVMSNKENENKTNNQKYKPLTISDPPVQPASVR